MLSLTEWRGNVDLTKTKEHLPELNNQLVDIHIASGKTNATNATRVLLGSAAGRAVVVAVVAAAAVAAAAGFTLTRPSVEQGLEEC